MKIARVFIFSLIISVLATSCKSRKLAGNNGSNSLNEQFWSNQQDFDHLSLGGKITINSNGSDQTASVSIRMAKDSLVWLTARVFGFEGARALITKDSFKMIDKVNKVYYSYGIDALESYLGFKMTIGQLQNILIANALFEKENYQVFDSSGFIRATVGSLTNTNSISEKGRLKMSKYTSTSISQKTDIQYTEYESFDNLVLPKFINTSMTMGGNKSSVVINYQSANTRPISNFPFSIPDGYTKK